MNIQEVANRLVELCRKGEFMKAYDELFAATAIAVEPEGSNSPKEIRGLENLRKKSQDFGDSIEKMHSIEVSEPIIADKFFSVALVLDCTFRGRGRMAMAEICVYEVKNGKIVREQFFYSPLMAEA